MHQSILTNPHLHVHDDQLEVGNILATSITWDLCCGLREASPIKAFVQCRACYIVSEGIKVSPSLWKQILWTEYEFYWTRHVHRIVRPSVNSGRSQLLRCKVSEGEKVKCR